MLKKIFLRNVVTDPEEIRKAENEHYEQLYVKEQIILTYTNSYREKTEHFPAHSMRTV